VKGDRPNGDRLPQVRACEVARFFWPGGFCYAICNATNAAFLEAIGMVNLIVLQKVRILRRV